MSDRILLDSDPREAGRCTGALVAGRLRDLVSRMWAQSETAHCGPTQLDERGERFRAFVGRIAPEWLDEAEAVGAAAGVNPSDIFVLNALPGGFWSPPAGNCTSCLVVGSASATTDTLLHKNRDLLDSIQTFHVARLAGGGQVFASRDVGNIGIGHFHSDRPLAGANNTGSPLVEGELRDCGLTCCHLLRLVAERAFSCDEAVAVLEDALAREVAGGSGGTRGMIFLFADPDRGVLVEMTSRRLAVREVCDDTLVRSNHFLLDEMLPFAQPPTHNTLRRAERARELLAASGQPNLADLQRLARDHADGPDSICCDDAEHFWMTVSACTHVVRPQATDPLAHTRAMMGHPHNTLAIPVPRAIDGLPAACVSGELHELARALYRAKGCGAHMAALQETHERAMAMELASVGAAARFGPEETLREALGDFVARAVERVRTALEGLLP